MCFDSGTLQLKLLGVLADVTEQYRWSSVALKLFATMCIWGFGSGGKDPAALLATSPQSPPPASLLVRLCRYL